MTTQTVGTKRPGTSPKAAKLARAYIQCSTADEDGRLSFVHARVDDKYDYVGLTFVVEGYGWDEYRALLSELDVFEYVPPRTLRRREQVVREALFVVDRLGWTLTPDELEVLERMATDRTRESVA